MNEKLYLIHQTEIQRKLKANPKSFWQHVNEQRKDSGIPSTMVLDDVEASSIEDIAELFRVHFCSVFVDEQLSDEEVFMAASNISQRLAFDQMPEVSCQLVETIGNNLKISTNPGPDGIPSIVQMKMHILNRTAISANFQHVSKEWCFSM